MSEIRARFTVRGPNITDPVVYVTTDGDFLVGRTPENDLRLQGKRISRQHMRIFWNDDDENFYLEDLKSTNGVWVEQQRVPSEVPIRLLPGYGIQLGAFSMILEAIEGLDDEHISQIPKTDTNVREKLKNLIPQRPTRRPRWEPIAPSEGLVPKNRRNIDIETLPTDRSNWLQYLPAIFADPNLDPTFFTARYLAIFETMMQRVVSMIDNFDLYLSPETAPAEWLQWMGSWFDMTLLAHIPIENQREVMKQIGWLYLRRGTVQGLERLLSLFCGVKAIITEPPDQPCHFEVVIPLSESDIDINPDVLDHLVASQAPAFTTFTVSII